MARIGYARISPSGQNLDSQIETLRSSGCEKIFQDKSSGGRESRPEWDKLLECARSGDTIVVVDLSRMTRSLMHLLKLSREFEDKGISITSLRENIDTSAATGKAFFSIINAISQMERELKSERVVTGHVSAKASGRTGGRRKIDPLKLEQARMLYEKSDSTAAEACEAFDVSRRTFLNYFARCRGIKPSLLLQRRLGAAKGLIKILDPDLA